MLASFVVSLYLFGIPNRVASWLGAPSLFPVPGVVAQGGPSGDAWLMLITVAASTVVWITVTLLTAPEPASVLESFYARVRPGGPGWARVSTAAGFGREPIPGGALAWTNWVAGIVAVYSSLFGIGKLIFGDLALGAVFLVLAALSFAWIARTFRSDLSSPPRAVPLGEPSAAD